MKEKQAQVWLNTTNCYKRLRMQRHRKFTFLNALLLYSFYQRKYLIERYNLIACALPLELKKPACIRIINLSDKRFRASFRPRSAWSPYVYRMIYNFP